MGRRFLIRPVATERRRPNLGRATVHSYDPEYTWNHELSRLWGFEVESDFDVAYNLSIYGSVGCARTEFLEFDSTGGLVEDLESFEFASAPRWTWAAGFNWRHQTGVSANVNVSRRGSQYQDLIDQSVRNVPLRTLVNAKVGGSNDKFGAYVVASNILDKKFFDCQYDNNGRLNALLGEPRMIGLTFEAKF